MVLSARLRGAINPSPQPRLLLSVPLLELPAEVESGPCLPIGAAAMSTAVTLLSCPASVARGEKSRPHQAFMVPS